MEETNHNKPTGDETISTENNNYVVKEVTNGIHGTDGNNGTNGVEAVVNNIHNSEAVTNNDDTCININVDGVSINFNISKLLQQLLSNN